MDKTERDGKSYRRQTTSKSKNQLFLNFLFDVFPVPLILKFVCSLAENPQKSKFKTDVWDLNI